MFAKYTVRQTVYLLVPRYCKMISPMVQAAEPVFLFFASIFTLPWTLWNGLKEIIRSTVSLNGYTAVDPDGVLGEEKEVNDDKDEAEEEGENKEEDG